MGKVSEGSKAARFRFIESHRDAFGVRYLCSRLGVSPAGFYKWAGRTESERDVENRALSQQIKQIFAEHNGNYGSPRVYTELRSSGISVNKKRVERIMRDIGLIGKAGRIYRRKALLGNPCIRVPNYRLDLDAPTAPDQQWAGDVTYLKVNGQRLYLAVIIDLYSRRIVGWSLDRYRTVELTIKALENALAHRDVGPGLVFHSDRGSEYGAYSYQKLLKSVGITPSMNRPRYMTDNAHVESFFRTMKTESFKCLEFGSMNELRVTLSWYIDIYYNTRRRHSGLGYSIPSEYEQGEAAIN
ncbi:MAG: IS3 family transposase [Spongiibacter sp.]|nr:IS3 family transposase [Spongiibacter sp.]